VGRGDRPRGPARRRRLSPEPATTRTVLAGLALGVGPVRPSTRCACTPPKRSRTTCTAPRRRSIWSCRCRRDPHAVSGPTDDLRASGRSRHNGWVTRGCPTGEPFISG
jgi:hypothetical protein